jgi:hypothetical protein
MTKKSLIIISIIVDISIILIIESYYQTNTNIYENNSNFSNNNIPYVFAQDDNDGEYEDDAKAGDFEIDPIMKIVPRDFSEGCKGASQFPQNYKMKIEHLKRLSSSQLMEYSFLTSLHDIDLKIILRCLDANTLEKVLLSIPVNDLISIYDRMTPREFNKIIYKLGDDSKAQIMNRMVLSN